MDGNWGGGPERGDAPPDGVPRKYLKFGWGLVIYLTVGFTTLLAIGGNGNANPGLFAWECGGAVMLAALGFAFFAWLRWKWRAFLLGALVAMLIITIVAASLLLFLKIADASLTR